MFQNGRFSAKENGFICLKSMASWTSQQTNPSRGQALPSGIGVSHDPNPFMTAAVADWQSLMGGGADNVVRIMAGVAHEVTARCAVTSIENLTVLVSIIRHVITSFPPAL